MKVKLITIGRFHHFHVARQLHKFKSLDEIYSGYPKFNKVMLHFKNDMDAKIKKIS